MQINHELMNIRAKYRLLLVVWIVSATALGLGSMYITEYFIIPLLVVTFVVGGYCTFLKCPNCGKPVLYNPLKILGINFHVWTPRIPKKCTKCGGQLN